MSTEGQYCSCGCRPTRGCRHSGRGDPKAQGDESRDRVAASWPSQRLHPPSLSLSLSLSLSASLDLEVSTHHCALPRQHGLQEEFSKNYTFVPPRGARAFFVLPHEKGHWTRPGAKVDHGPLQLPFRKRPTSAFVPSAKQQTPEPRPERGKVARRATPCYPELDEQGSGPGPGPPRIPRARCLGFLNEI